ncbi:hypothetical protein Q9R19_03000 [Microbacterium sp. ARD32]|uniref:hypothetical protein n=1 Tax=Microbacterium sp. ARD32 TaxID=2962577 RepID=UPI002881A3C8|nr:hypothetical protein [Microbacterium sp. ARD32]MDT0156588.1 hypothetical protein [Microbacterium sp. ARD32]
MSALADDIARAVLADAGLAQDDGADAPPPDAEAFLALIASSAAAEREIATLLQRSVASARAAGVSWARIGGELGMTRQAAQQRFGRGDAVEAQGERWLGPVTAFDEMAELELAGRQGWHSVEVQLLSHRLIRSDTQWQHRRILWRGSLARERAEGWEVGSRAFPWIYLVRDTGMPAEPSA